MVDVTPYTAWVQIDKLFTFVPGMILQVAFNILLSAVASSLDLLAASSPIPSLLIMFLATSTITLGKLYFSCEINNFYQVALPEPAQPYPLGLCLLSK